MTKPKMRARGPAVLIAMFSIPVNQPAKPAAASLVRSKRILSPALLSLLMPSPGGGHPNSRKEMVSGEKFPCGGEEVGLENSTGSLGKRVGEGGRPPPSLPMKLVKRTDGGIAANFCCSSLRSWVLGQ